MSVLRKQSNEMSAVHLVKTCLPTLMYGCEAWTLTDGSLHKLKTDWNNCFRRIVILCCWRKSTRPLQFFCKSLPFYLLLDQLKLNLWMKIPRSNNAVLQTLSSLNYYELLAICSKYNIDTSHMSENIVKQTLWNVFSHTADILLYCCHCGVINDDDYRQTTTPAR